MRSTAGKVLHRKFLHSEQLLFIKIRLCFLPHDGAEMPHAEIEPGRGRAFGAEKTGSETGVDLGLDVADVIL